MNSTNWTESSWLTLATVLVMRLHSWWWRKLSLMWVAANESNHHGKCVERLWYLPAKNGATKLQSVAAGWFIVRSLIISHLCICKRSPRYQSVPHRPAKWHQIWFGNDTFSKWVTTKVFFFFLYMFVPYKWWSQWFHYFTFISGCEHLLPLHCIVPTWKPLPAI